MAVAADRAGTVRHGILWMLLTMLLFVSLDATGKQLALHYPLSQVVWARCVFHLAFLLVILAPRLPVLLATRRPGLQLVRSAFLVTVTVLFFAGLKHIPLVDASAIMFLTPILVTALSMPLLGEHVGPRRWAGVAIGLLGALVIVRPGLGVFQAAALLVLASALVNALYQIATRRLRSDDPPLTTLLYTPLVGAVVASAVVPFTWQAPDLEGWLLMAAMGLLGGAGHYTLIRAFGAAPPATVAPFSYTSLIWSSLFGLVLFDEVPDGWTLAGAAVIIGSGLYIFHREQLRARHGG